MLLRLNINQATFGSPMPNRSFSASSYRYGYNNMEKDDEIKGSGNSLDFGARIYDSRLGRWLACDALFQKYPFISPYNANQNSPILFRDVDGNDILPSASFLANKNLSTAYKALINAPTSKETLAKFASNKTPISAYGKDGVLSKTFNVEFTSFKGGDAIYANTKIYAVSKDGSKYDLGNPADFAAIHPSQVTKDTKFVAEMSFNEVHTNKLDETLESAVHEFAIHFDDAVPLFENLKTGKIDGAEFLTQWKELNVFGNELNVATQHTELGAGKDDSYNKITNEVKSLLSDKKDKADFSKKVNDEKDRYSEKYPEIKSDKK